MESLYLLIPLSIVIAFVIGFVFWWTIRSGQLDDLEGPSWRILHDNDNYDSKEADSSEEKQKFPD
ncbi:MULTISPECIES: cbb3-type cytochrome oxidase assembly protein CcoS [Deefgea]|uniref:Cbb3-type cytochrome oxidase assembly protein CcoS n=1 Tax=Deefgea chitinilytica TaxID=570276 RepID=A0ABS2CAU6_9NEIS|nr:MULTISPECIES: cbb3-type cytochrome oxidase assembly protein CcoS [Deefgea]MBM5570578.1 cbb3-type cytochrome oxidase assembly protein CcoS [Deefgea chitinilytica]MBM9887807.1 cbb3-type cytochrome oxidase assembly protein CcoS [Deefgea sp. CFH1-16]